MFKSIICMALLTLPLLAQAQSTIPKVGNKCPSGYSDGKGAWSRQGQALHFTLLPRHYVKCKA